MIPSVMYGKKEQLIFCLATAIFVKRQCHKKISFSVLKRAFSKIFKEDTSALLIFRAAK
jgi:hypothetical protein